MSVQANELIKLLDEFDIQTLTDEGIDARHAALRAAGVKETWGSVFADVYDMADRFKALVESDMIEVLPHMFALIERAGDLEIASASPGPIVHAIESSKTAYQPFLLASLKRMPTASSVWMLNRWANTCSGEELERLMTEMQAAGAHPGASQQTREEAENFLQYQKTRSW